MPAYLPDAIAQQMVALLMIIEDILRGQYLNADSWLKNTYQQVQQYKSTFIPVIENNKLNEALNWENSFE